MKTKTIGILNVDGTKTLKTVPVQSGSCLKSLQEAVGGNIETVFLPKFKGQLYANEEGLLIGLPLNAWSHKIGHPIVGPMVAYFSGRDFTEADFDKIRA